jgi:hypothetical protein
MDGFDWGYVGSNRDTVIEKIQRCEPYYNVDASTNGMLIIYIDKNPPQQALAKLKASGVVWDVAYAQRDNATELKECRLTNDVPDTTRG